MLHVQGYMVRTHEMMDQGKEQLFAKFEDGKIISTIRNYSDSFIDKRNKWLTVSEIPDGAKFIGRYPSPLS